MCKLSWRIECIASGQPWAALTFNHFTNSLDIHLDQPGICCVIKVKPSTFVKCGHFPFVFNQIIFMIYKIFWIACNYNWNCWRGERWRAVKNCIYFDHLFIEAFVCAIRKHSIFLPAFCDLFIWLHFLTNASVPLGISFGWRRRWCWRRRPAVRKKTLMLTVSQYRSSWAVQFNSIRHY